MTWQGVLLLVGVSAAFLTIVWWQTRKIMRLTRSVVPRAVMASTHDTASPVPRARCAGCRHFDLEEGQAILRMYPAFPKEDLPPCLVGAQYDEKTGGLLRNENVPARCSWDAFGACTKHSELRWNEDGCDDFEPGPV